MQKLNRNRFSVSLVKFCETTTTTTQHTSLFNKLSAEFKDQPMLGIDFLGDLSVPWRRKPKQRPNGSRPRYSGVVLELNSSPQMFCHTLRRSTFNLGIIQKILMEASIEARIKRVSVEKRKSTSKRRRPSSKRRAGSGSKTSVFESKKNGVRPKSRSGSGSINY